MFFCSICNKNYDDIKVAMTCCSETIRTDYSMSKDRFNQLYTLVNSDFTGRHDLPQLNFSLKELQWLMKTIKEQEEYIKFVDNQDFNIAYEAAPKTLIDITGRVENELDK